jgi:lipopolysaccharide transport system ATP-binding protein
VLSRVTAPTSGYVEIHGRVASLLEVGTGFHQELSGRENIFLNGSILGMGRREIRSKFDEIVEFAGVEEFLDTPVKRYSSGMHLRLAFSVAAHLDPEILIIDEVLAVGDFAFQKKCVGKMSEVARQHRTVLFVSHNLSAVQSLCSRGIVIESGQVVMDASVAAATEYYVKSFGSQRSIGDEGMSNRQNRTSGAARFTKVVVQDDNDKETWQFQSGESLHLCLRYKAFQDVPSLGFYMSIRAGNTGETLTTMKEVLSRQTLQKGREGELRITLPHVPLRTGSYLLYLCLGDAECDRFYDVIDENVSLPCLSITSAGDDPHLAEGFFTLPYQIEHRP